MFNVSWVEIAVFVAVIAVVLGAVYRFIGWVVNREMRKHERT